MTNTFSYGHIRDEKAMAEYIASHNATSPFLVIDLETTGLSKHTDTIIHGVVGGPGTTDEFSAATLVEPECLKQLMHITTPIVMHNMRFDLSFLLKAGIDLRNKQVYDTMLLHHLFDENIAHDLNSIIKERYRDDYKELFWSKFTSYESADYNSKLEYACKDVIYTVKLYNELRDLLQMQDIPDSLIEHVHKLAVALFNTEYEGIAVDFDYLHKIGDSLKEKIAKSKAIVLDKCQYEIEGIRYDMWTAELDKRKTARGKAGVPKPEFSLDSGKQMQELMYGRLKLPVQKNQKTRRPSLDDDALSKLEGTHEVITPLREYREHNKTYGAFIEGTLDRAISGRIYPSFNVNGTTNARISSSNPNLQQLPRNGGVRGIYIPDPGHKLVGCDFGQIEVVVAAHFSRDKNLLKIIYEGASKHDITADALKVERQVAKTINFACQYGAGPWKLARIVGGSEATGKEIYERYWQAYAGEKKVIDECNAKVDRGEPIVSPWGRRRRFPSKFEHEKDRAMAYRQAYSSLIQGTAADLTHWSFYTIAATMIKNKLGRALFEIHDEILIMPEDNYCDQSSDLLKLTMLQSGKQIQLSVPLTIDCSSPMNRWED